MFSAEEAVTVSLGTRPRAGGITERDLQQTALSKIKRALPIAEAERVDALLGVMTHTSQHGAAPRAPGGRISTLAEAVHVDRRLRPALRQP